MSEPRSAEPNLPQAIEDEVLGILEGDENSRDLALAALLARHPEHERTLRRWLSSAGVAVPGGTATGSGGGATPEALPMRLGPYVLQALLGRGGFGSVYRAEQQEPIRRPVAVKVLNPGMDSREILGRFAAEREALNRMDHPGIARLLDAGTTPQGRPYFVMELVEGPTLANHCRRQDLPLRERLLLFLQVLDAMQHAHQKAVLHRDLSSNNVLVADPAGRALPKIIDFGIAKSLSDPLLQGGALTFQGTLMGTPEFMSPEQAAGRIDAIDTRADVYALGAQLYELLTDQVPIPGVVLRAQGLAGMAEVIRNQPVPPPSAVAPRDRRALLAGDLDAIVAKALAKARDERYATVAEFAADLRRHLADEPVQVAAPTTWHRLRKFVKRHRTQTIAAAIVAGGLVVALGVLGWALHVQRTALQQLAAQKREIEAKADAGFRLLANEERLRGAIEAQAVLPPPWPEHGAAIAAWLEQRGRPLAAARGRLEEELERLRGKQARSRGGTFEDPADQHLFAALQRLLAGLQQFAGPGGALQRVERRLLFLQQVVAPAAAEHGAAWRAAIASIKRSDGTDANAAYRGAGIPELAGLVPLGVDPGTLLHEFVDLASHPRGSPLPVRGADGQLRADGPTGIVFVLLPAGTLRIGAYRGEPGLPQNDPNAEDDELGGQLVRLDEFLLARTEVTAAQWAALTDGSAAGAGQLPATGIGWHEAREVLRGFDLDLPTEAQWEYACRAGTVTPYSTGDSADGAAEAGWFGPRPQRVAQLRRNAFGLFDVHGNAAEWCRDEHLPYAGTTMRAGDGLRERAGADAGAAASAPRTLRGGACHQGPLAARCSAREPRAPQQADGSTGIRPVRLLRR